MRRRNPGLAVLLALVLAGCTSPAGGGEPGGGSLSRQRGADVPAAIWRTAELVDVRSGEHFTLSAFKGKVVAIEPMAIWCINCAQQQEQASATLGRLPAGVVYVSLAVDPRETAPELARYANERGFGWRFAVSPPEVSRSLASDFGDIVLSPPSTPLIVLDRDGEVVEKHFGGLGADRLVALLGGHLE
jgi:thiol-disulfide isomerase/thioredoxin